MCRVKETCSKNQMVRSNQSIPIPIYLKTLPTFSPPETDSSYPNPNGNDPARHRTRNRAIAEHLLSSLGHHRTSPRHRRDSAETPSNRLAAEPMRIDPRDG